MSEQNNITIVDSTPSAITVSKNIPAAIDTAISQQNLIFDYSDAGALSSISKEDGKIIQFAFLENGSLSHLEITEPNGRVYQKQFVRDEEGRITAINNI